MAGGAVGAMTGQGFWEGATGGAAMGLVTGGVGSLFGGGSAASSTATQAKSGAGAATTTTGEAVSSLADGGAFVNQGALRGAIQRATPNPFGGVGAGAAQTATKEVAKKSVMQAIKSKAVSTLTDPAFLGPVLVGVGGGIARNAQAENELEELRKRRDEVQGNFRGLGDLIWPWEENPLLRDA